MELFGYNTLIPLSYLVICGSNLFGWLMSSWGIQLLKLLPSGTILSQRFLSFILAALIHLGLFIGYAMLAKENRKNARYILLFAFLILIISIVCYFSFVSITYESKSDASYESLNTDLDSFRTLLSQEDQKITAVFSSQLNHYQTIADNAAKGLDGTGIVKKGTNYFQAITARDNLSRRYGNLTYAVTHNALEDTDINIYWSSLKAQYQSLQGKITAYHQFVSKEGVSSQVSDLIDSEFQLIEKRFSQGEAVDKVGMTLKKVNDFITNKERSDITMYLYLIIAILPELLNFTMTILIGSARKELEEAKKVITPHPSLRLQAV